MNLTGEDNCFVPNWCMEKINKLRAKPLEESWMFSESNYCFMLVRQPHCTALRSICWLLLKSKTANGLKGSGTRAGKRRTQSKDKIARTSQISQRESLYSNFALWNARSIKNKTHMICELIISKRLDILAITETWLCGDERDNRPLADLSATLPTHQFIHVPRKDRSGGGVGVCILKLNENKTEVINFSSRHRPVLVLSQVSH